MTKTIEPVTNLPSQRDIKNGKSSREASTSPPLVLKYLETLPPEKAEVTLMVEVVPGPPKVEFKVPKIIAENPVVPVNNQATKTIASVVKAEIKEDIDEDEVIAELDEDEDEECYRIIEETVVDVSTLPGRTS